MNLPTDKASHGNAWRFLLLYIRPKKCLKEIYIFRNLPDFLLEPQFSELGSEVLSTDGHSVLSKQLRSFENNHFVLY